MGGIGEGEGERYKMQLQLPVARTVWNTCEELSVVTRKGDTERWYLEGVSGPTCLYCGGQNPERRNQRKCATCGGLMA